MAVLPTAISKVYMHCLGILLGVRLHVRSYHLVFYMFYEYKQILFLSVLYLITCFKTNPYLWFWSGQGHSNPGLKAVTVCHPIINCILSF